MKKIVSLVLCLSIIATAFLGVFHVSAASENEITVRIDGQNVEFDVPPLLMNNRTMVPLRAIFEALGATVEWNADARTVTSSKGNTTIVLTINSPTMYVNGAEVLLDSPACLANNRTFVPVRAISEGFGTVVDWDSNTKTVMISSPVSENDKGNTERQIAYEKVTSWLVSKGLQYKGAYCATDEVADDLWISLLYYDGLSNDSHEGLFFYCHWRSLEISASLMFFGEDATPMASIDDEKGILPTEYVFYYDSGMEFRIGDVSSELNDTKEKNGIIEMLNAVYALFDEYMREVLGLDVKISDFGIDY